jgi:hypothetical protein
MAYLVWRKKTTIRKVQTIINYDYTISCEDRKGTQIVFRDIAGSDIEFLDHIIGKKEKFLSTSDVISILERIRISPQIPLSYLTPKILKTLYSCVSKNILCNYINKEVWLRQCYSIQNGSFQGISEMEKVPMSKFIAMCTIHKEAMDQINTPTTASV